MKKITVGQFLSFTNVYVPIYIEDEFMRYNGFGGIKVEYLFPNLTDKQKECPIDYIRNVDGGHFGDNAKIKTSIVLGIGIENYEEYFISKKE